MSLTERLKRKISKSVLGPRNPDSLKIENLFFDPNINLPTSSSTNNSSACSSFESVSSRPRQPPDIKPEPNTGVDEERGLPPPLPIPNEDRGVVVSTLSVKLEQTFYSSTRAPTLKKHRHLQTSPARIGQDSFRDIGGVARKSASVSKSFHSNQFNESQYLSPAPLPQHRKPQVNTQDPSQHHPQLLASSIFDTSTTATDSSLFSLKLEEPTQVPWNQSMNVPEPTSMATMRASAFLDPNLARSSRLPESQIFTRNEAKKQEAVIHAKLKSAGEPIPPYEFLNFIGKGSYGRVYLA